MHKGQVMEVSQGMFSLPKEQLEAVRRWNIERGWGFTDDDFAAAKAAMPKRRLRSGSLVTRVLAVRLIDADGVPGAQRTFRELLALACAPFASEPRWEGIGDADACQVRIADERPYRGGTLRWLTLDLGADIDVAPAAFSPDERRPGLSILAAAALHPGWLRAMDGGNVPYPWIAGLDVSCPGGRPWSAKPRLGFSQPTREVRLHAIDGSKHHRCWSVPAFVGP